MLVTARSVAGDVCTLTVLPLRFNTVQRTSIDIYSLAFFYDLDLPQCNSLYNHHNGTIYQPSPSHIQADSEQIRKETESSPIRARLSALTCGHLQTKSKTPFPSPSTATSSCDCFTPLIAEPPTFPTPKGNQATSMQVHA